MPQNFLISVTRVQKLRDLAQMVNYMLNLDNMIPGPGSYKEISNLSKVGKYVVSNHVGGTKAIFDHQKRISKFDQAKIQAMEKPGPGYYRVPS